MIAFTGHCLYAALYSRTNTEFRLTAAAQVLGTRLLKKDILMTFNDLGLSAPILKAVANKGYETPSPIQEKAIPAVLEGQDVMAAAQTGTGKTAGFVLPILERLCKGHPAKANQARVLILTPTRELAAQVGASVMVYSKYVPLSSAVVFGGVKINPQMMKLRRGVDILVATPGRLLDLHNQNAVRFDHLEVLVLDEADRMLDMGFIRDIKRIITLLPKRRQNLMFSATFSDDIRQLAKGLVHDPIEISVSPKNAAAPTVEQSVYTVDKKNKAPLLTKLIKDGGWYQALVFTKTKHRANKLTKHLESEGIIAAAIHGNKSQGARTKALAEFKSGKIQILVATDIAARGLDIEQLPQVVNFDLPNVSEDYVHRIGRTGRAGLTGAAISLVSADEVDLLSSIERLIQKKLPRKEIEGFEPDHVVKETTLSRPVRAKKPRKPMKNTTSARDGSRDHKNTGNRKRRPAYGKGAETGNQAKSGNRNTTAKSSQNNETASGYRSRSNETASGHRSRSNETASGYRSRSNETASGYRSRSNETASGHRSRSNETASGHRSRSNETASGNRSRSNETRSGNRSRSNETASGNRSRANETASGNRSRANETASGNRSSSNGTASGNRSRSNETRSSERTPRSYGNNGRPSEASAGRRRRPSRNPNRGSGQN